MIGVAPTHSGDRAASRGLNQRPATPSPRRSRFRASKQSFATSRRRKGCVSALRLSDRDRIFSIAHLPSRSVDLASRFCEADPLASPQGPRRAVARTDDIAGSIAPEIGIALDEMVEPVAIEMLAWWKSANGQGTSDGSESLAVCSVRTKPSTEAQLQENSYEVPRALTYANRLSICENLEVPSTPANTHEPQCCRARCAHLPAPLPVAEAEA